MKRLLFISGSAFQIPIILKAKETAYKATNKCAMIKAFEKYGVAYPKFQLVKKDEIDKCKIDMPFPVISKPTDAAASRGVCKIER